MFSIDNKLIDCRSYFYTSYSTDFYYDIVSYDPKTLFTPIEGYILKYRFKYTLTTYEDRYPDKTEFKSTDWLYLKNSGYISCRIDTYNSKENVSRRVYSVSLEAEYVLKE